MISNSSSIVKVKGGCCLFFVVLLYKSTCLLDACYLSHIKEEDTINLSKVNKSFDNITFYRCSFHIHVYYVHIGELTFLIDFISCLVNTAGGRVIELTIKEGR